MNPTKEPIILALERVADFPVRIDWLGDVITTFRRGVRGQFIKVACSRSDSTSSWSGYSGSHFRVTQLEALVPIAFLRRLRVGDIWHEGYRVGKAALEKKVFERLRIDRTTSELVPAGGASACSDGVERHEVPFDDFVGHRAFTTSHLVKVRVNANTNMLVPCTEIARMYFGASGGLVSKVFSGALALESLYDPSTAFVEQRYRDMVAKLVLGRGLTFHAAPAVARVAFDPAARQGFTNLVNSGVGAGSRGEPWLVKLHFPIEGLTDLNVRGLWLDRGPDRSFLVLELVSCSHAFPFDVLLYDLHPDQAGAALGAQAARPDAEDAQQDRDRGRRGSGHKLDSGQANQDLSPLVLDDDEAIDPFPDLASKRVIRVYKEPRPAALAPRQTQPEDPGPHAPVDSPHSPDAPRAVEIAAARRLYSGGNPEPRSLMWLRDEIAQSLPEVSIKSPLDESVASRVLVDRSRRRGFSLVKTAPLWVTVFRYALQEGIGRSFLCTVVETPATDESIELLMFDLPDPQSFNQDLLSRLSELSFVSLEALPRNAVGTDLRIAWTKGELARQDAADLAVQMVEMMIESFDRDN